MDLLVELRCSNCQRAGGLRPDIVWFGEMPKHMVEIDRLLQEVEMFVAIGSSGKVYPSVSNSRFC